MQIDWAIVLASVIVGFTVGLTGMGGGALMTPILLIFFGITPTAAVSSDLVAAMVMKPIGGGVHIRRKTVRWELVRWLCVGSIPMAFAGVFLLNATGDSEQIQNTTQLLLGITLLLAAFAMVFKAWLQGTRSKAARLEGRATHMVGAPIQVRVIPTILIGAAGGLLVGPTSVGSGSLIIICLMLLYPDLRGAELVGTDLVQAVPLVTSAAIAHFIVGDFVVGLTASILIGAIPAVYVGARVSSKAPDGVIRPLLVLVLMASALKLLEVPTGMVGLILLAVIVVGFPLWGAVDASGYPVGRWESLGLDRRRSIRRQAWGAPVLVGFPYAIQYFARTRPQLVAVPSTVEIAGGAPRPGDVPEEG
ncbi:MAG: sulfite exporter TauE/SafE family protein [Actinomycetota bacterium]